MKFLYVLLCCLMTEYLSADIMDTLVGETLNLEHLSKHMTTGNLTHAALGVKNVLKQLPNDKTQNKKRTSQKKQIAQRRVNNSWGSTSKNSGNFISREALFAENSIKTVYLSSNGQMFAYIAKDAATKLDTIHILPIKNKGTFGTVINDGVSVLEMAFVGDDYIVYTYSDVNQNIKLKSVNLSNGNRRDITPIRNASRLHIVSGQDAIISICNNGKQYFTHKIDVSTGKTQLIKQADTPIIALFDEKLVPTLFYKNIRGMRADVFINTVVKGDPVGEQLVDSIDMSKEKYVAVSQTSCYKLKQKGNAVYLCSRSLNSGQERTMLIPKAESIRDCTVHLNKENRPVFVSVSKGRISRTICNQSVKHSVNILSNKFRDSDWSKVGESNDGKIWMIRVQDSKKPTEYYLFNTNTDHFKFLVSSNASAQNLALRDMRCVNIPMSNNRSLVGYLTLNKNNTTSTPLVICVNSDAEHRYAWEYNPLSQLLANRGMAVLCVDCHAETIYDDIERIIRWCINKKLATAGNIYLSAKKSACEPAAKLFLDHPTCFAGCALLSSDIWDKLSAHTNMIQKPILIIDEMQEGDFHHLDVDDSLPVTYIGYTRKLSNGLSAALLEKFFAINAGLPYVDITVRDSNNLMVLIDGLDLIQQRNIASHNNMSVYDVL